MNKLEQQASGKAELSYSYWAANAADEAPAPKPKKLTEEEAAAAAAAQQLRHSESGASAWNSAGTFEERSLPMGWLREQLSQQLCALKHSHAGAEVAVAEVTECSGEGHQWIVRGKKRAGFELEFAFRWRVQLDGDSGAEICGTARVPHAAHDELEELQLEITADSKASAANAAASAATGGDVGSAAPSEEQQRRACAAVESLLPRLGGVLQQLLERMRDK